MLITDDEDWVLVAGQLDKQFYELQAGQVFASVHEAAAHYLEQGAAAGLDPSPEFSTRDYLRLYPDVAVSGMNPLRHYVVHGLLEGRVAVPSSFRRPDWGAASGGGLPQAEMDRLLAEEYFDPDYYYGTYPDMALYGGDLLEHFLSTGWRENRNPSASFDTAAYLSAHPALLAQGINPLVHWARREKGLPVPGGEPAATPAPEPVVSEAPADAPPAAEPAAWPPEWAVAYEAFDAEHYAAANPDLRGTKDALFAHYMEHGWREHRNPSREFSTAYYLRHNRDIANAGINPFLHYLMHGRREGRVGLPYSDRCRLSFGQPLVTAIIPNFNHARFLAERFASIDEQDWEHLEILILDDASTDDSRAVIEALESRRGRVVRKVFNESNSGGVFRQWQKGFSLAQGDYVWICESDDVCERDFLSSLMPHFANRSVMIGFGRIQFCDAQGQMQPGLDAYREAAEPGLWRQGFARPAAQWFAQGFGVSNLIANVGGCVIRRQDVAADTWAEACRYRISGDWYLYLQLARGGLIAYEPQAVAYFRQHGHNTSVKGFLRPEYYSEHERVALAMRQSWAVGEDVTGRLYANLVKQYHHVGARKVVGPLDRLFRLPKVLRERKQKPHILIAFLGFHLGGGELVPIHLANALADLGFNISMLALDPSDENPEIRRILRPSVVVYDAQYVEERGVETFLQEAGVDLIHSHAAAVEFFFFQKHRLQTSLPYVVTLHGSYEVTPVPDDLMFRIVRGVTHWFYLADKNLGHLKGVPLDARRVTHIDNGMPVDERPFPQTRAELGIGEDAFVFAIASRAIKEKGWGEAVQALERLRQRSPRELWLLICGDGKDLEALQARHGHVPGVRFLGYQDRIDGLYRMADCVMLPSRFKGESFPLTLIQAMLVGKPIIATRVGQIASMLQRGERACGLLVDGAIEDDEVFVRHLAEAMEQVLDDGLRHTLSACAAEFGTRYSVADVARRYATHFRKYIQAARA